MEIYYKDLVLSLSFFVGETNNSRRNLFGNMQWQYVLGDEHSKKKKYTNMPDC